MKRKLCLSVLFAGVALSAGAQERPRPDPETAQILTSVGMTYDEARAQAGGKTVGVYYDPYYSAGEAYSSPGEKTCSISWSMYGEGLSSGFVAADMKAIGMRYDPAIDKDIEKITMLHELGHCTQIVGNPENEYKADEKAVGRYLEQGGSRDTALYWIYWRTLDGILYSDKRKSSTDVMPTVGLRLHAKYFGGDAPAPEKIRAAYDEIVPLMKGLDAAGRKARVGELLAEDKTALSPDARKLLRFYAEAFRYMAEGPAPVKAPRPPGPA